MLYRSFRYLCLIFCLSCLASNVFSETTRAAVASNFSHAAKEIFATFEGATGHKVKASYASTGKLFAQIKYGAPYHLFLAADTKTAKRAELEGLSLPGSRFTYAKGTLALWYPSYQSTPQPSPTVTFATLPSLGGSTLALAKPKLAPYGRAAEQVLSQWEKEGVSFKKVFGQSVSQAFQFVATGSSKLGLVAVSQLIAYDAPPSSWLSIPKQHYDPIAQQVVLLNKGKDHAATIALFEYLQQAQAREIVLRYGYTLDSP